METPSVVTATAVPAANATTTAIETTSVESATAEAQDTETVLSLEVTAIVAFAKIAHPEFHLLEIVCPPQFRVLTTSCTASQQFGLAGLVLPACAARPPPQLCSTCPLPGVHPVPPPPPFLALEMPPAVGTPSFVPCNAGPDASKVPGLAGLVLHALLVPCNACFASSIHLLLPGQVLLPAKSTNLLPASSTSLVCFLPLSPACWLALAGIELLPGSSAPLPVEPRTRGTRGAETIAAATTAPFIFAL